MVGGNGIKLIPAIPTEGRRAPPSARINAGIHAMINPEKHRLIVPHRPASLIVATGHLG